MVANYRINYKNLSLLPDVERNALFEFQFGADEVEEGVEAVEAELALIELNGDNGVEPPEGEGDHGTGPIGVESRVGLVEVAGPI